MATTKSIEKRIRQNEKRRKRNQSIKKRIRAQRNKIEDAIEDGNSRIAEESLSQFFKLCDQAGGKGVIHQNKADRLKSRMAKKVNEISDE